MQPAAEGLGTFMGHSQWTHEQCVRGGRTRGLQQRVAALPRWRVIARLVEAGAGVRETCRQVACGRAAYYRAVQWWEQEQAAVRAARWAVVETTGNAQGKAAAGVAPLARGLKDTTQGISPWSRAVLEAWQAATSAPVPWLAPRGADP